MKTNFEGVPRSMRGYPLLSKKKTDIYRGEPASELLTGLSSSLRGSLPGLTLLEKGKGRWGVVIKQDVGGLSEGRCSIRDVRKIQKKRKWLTDTKLPPRKSVAGMGKGCRELRKRQAIFHGGEGVPREGEKPAR